MKRLQAIRQIVQIGGIVAVAVVGIGLSTLLASGSKLLSVQSGSMDPAIKKGDLVSVKRTPTRDLRVGDVVTYMSRENNKQTITHRIVAITGDMQGRITTQGDANQVADQSVTPSQIVGRVEHKLPYGGFIVDFVRHPVGLIFIIYLPALLIVLAEVRRLAAYYKVTKPYSARIGVASKDTSDLALHIPTGLMIALTGVGIFAALQAPVSAALKTGARIGNSTIQFVVPSLPTPLEPPAPPAPPTKPGQKPATKPSGGQRGDASARDERAGHSRDGDRARSSRR